MKGIGRGIVLLLLLFFVSISASAYEAKDIDEKNVLLGELDVFIEELRDYLDRLIYFRSQLALELQEEWDDWPMKEPAEIQGLIGRWRLDDASVGTALDTSPYQNHGLVVGAEPTEDWKNRPGQAYRFSGASPIDHIDIGNADLFTGMAQFTLAAWIKPEDFPSQYGTIISKHSINSNGEWYLAVKEKQVRFAHIDANNRRTNSHFDLPTPIASWIHVALVFDNGQIELYADGLLVGSASTGQGTKATDHPIYIGAISGSSFHRQWDFRGVIADVQLYNRPLSREEILLLQ